MVHTQWTVGDRVRLHFRHWVRPHALGTIVAIDLERNSDYVYYVQFDTLGRGIDGRFLWVDALNLEAIDEATNSNTKSATDEAKS